ncbi:MAG: hydroxyisourate hydrolase [Arenicellales bacterium]
MPELSSHILDGINGKSASGIRVQLLGLSSVLENKIVFDVVSDEQGRIAESVEIVDGDSEQLFEMVVYGHQYFVDMHQVQNVAQHMKQVVIRFSMVAREQRYHIPVVLSPHSYTVWWSD